jgi:hypothetical protein
MTLSFDSLQHNLDDNRRVVVDFSDFFHDLSEFLFNIKIKNVFYDLRNVYLKTRDLCINNI